MSRELAAVIAEIEGGNLSPSLKALSGEEQQIVARTLARARERLAPEPPAIESSELPETARNPQKKSSRKGKR